MSVQIAKRLFDVTEYHRLAEAGILSEDDRVELVNGEIVEIGPIGSPHAACVSRLAELLYETLGRRVQINVQNPIQLDDYSEPQPDLAVLKRRPDHYAQAHPRPVDILLVIEVAESSIEYDRAIKVPLYARAGIPEVWLIDLNQDRIRAFGEPRAREYQTRREFQCGQTIRSVVIADLTLQVDDILG